MGIVGEQPESGMRVVAERPRGAGPPWRYEGEAAVQDAHFHLVVTLDEHGVVNVDVDGEPPAGLGDKVRLIVRTAWRRAAEDGLSPPVRIARWRADF
jgi:hypothetical protein